MNDDRLYPIFDKAHFKDFVSASGLEPNTVMRLSPASISSLKETAKCFTERCIQSEIFDVQGGGLSGDIYVALTADNVGNQALVFNMVRTDYTDNQYVVDQEPVVICSEPETSACKIMHADWPGRTFSRTEYDSIVSAFSPDKKQDINTLPPEIYNAFPFACNYIQNCIDKNK